MPLAHLIRQQDGGFRDAWLGSAKLRKEYGKLLRWAAVSAEISFDPSSIRSTFQASPPKTMLEVETVHPYFNLFCK
jgi:hypothetical protein